MDRLNDSDVLWTTSSSSGSVKEAENIRPNNDNSRNKNSKKKDKKDWAPMPRYDGTAQPKFSCVVCNQDHPIHKCKDFMYWYTPEKRYEVLADNGYCFVCLSPSHITKKCKSKVRCIRCKKRHNDLLHDAAQLASTQKEKTNDEKPTSSVYVVKKQSIKPDPPFFNSNTVFIPTASIRIFDENRNCYDPDGSYISARAIVNRSLTTTRISKSLMDKFNFKTISRYAHDFAIFEMRSYNRNNKWSIEVTALITTELPRKPYSAPIKSDPSGDFASDTLADLDPQCNTAADVEIGSDIYYSIWRDGAIMTEVGQVVAEKSALGYLFSGPVQSLW